MKRFNNCFIFGGFILLAVFSCADMRQKEQVRAVERLSILVDSIQQVVSEELPDSMNRMRLNMMQTETALKNKLVMDTVDRAYALDMDTYKKARKSIGKWNGYYVELRTALKKEIKQLKTLKKDVQNGWGRRDQYNRYIQVERQNILILGGRLTELRKKAVTICDTYRLLHPKMAIILENIEH